MNNIDYIKILGIIGSIITFIITIYKKEEIKNSNMKNDYFQKLLIKYITLHKVNNNINPVKFIKKNYKLEDYFIPSYIFYLADNNEKDLLHKVLVVDYRNNFPSTNNIIGSTTNNISNILMMIMMYTYNLATFLSALFAINATIGLVDTIIYNFRGIRGSIQVGVFKFSDIGFSIFSILINIILSIICIYISKSIFKSIKDDYAIKSKDIEKILKRKQKEYNKSIGYYIQ